MSTTNEKVDRSVSKIEMSRNYVAERLNLAPGTHEHKRDEADPQGRCQFCSHPMRLMSKGRTGEITWD
jgi:hypothetical protein